METHAGFAGDVDCELFDGLDFLVHRRRRIDNKTQRCTAVRYKSNELGECASRQRTARVDDSITNTLQEVDRRMVRHLRRL